MRLTWAKPEDLVAHALRQAELDGVDVTAYAARWQEAGGDPAPPRSGASDVPATPQQRSLARKLIAELDGVRSAYDDREPTDLEAIRAVAPAWSAAGDRQIGVPDAELMDRVHGAWLGRAAGCLLGKPVEKVSRAGIAEILRATGRWPLADWFTAVGLPEEVSRQHPWNRRSAPTSLAESIDGMPEDDDLNFAMLNLALLERYGRDFDTEDVAELWLAELPAGRVFTAERIAYRNLLLGHLPPASARIGNPFRDWVGAQIRGDVFGWVRPGQPMAAADLAWTDGILSHTRNGVYGEMFVAAACSAAVVGASLAEVIEVGLRVVPPESRYAEAVRFGRDTAREVGEWEAVVDAIEARYGGLHWVHVLGNAALLIAALVHGQADFQPSICAVVSAGLDTDSNGATVGSLVGAINGAKALPQRWIAPLRNRVASTLTGFDQIGFDELARRTVALCPTDVEVTLC